MMAKAKTMFVSQEGPANALALNKDCNQVAIAGRNGEQSCPCFSNISIIVILVFKVYSIEAEEFVESCNLRVGKNINLNFSCNDVVWNAFDGKIITPFNFLVN
jgi:WD repeat-containing protein 24